MRLVRLDNYQVVIEDELLLLTPFRKLYKSDKTRGKDNFYNFLTIVYFKESATVAKLDIEVTTLI